MCIRIEKGKLSVEKGESKKINKIKKKFLPAALENTLKVCCGYTCL